MDDTTTSTIELIEKSSNKPNAKTILIIGVFHGEEPQGEYVINKYLENGNFENINNHLNFIPCLNPWGKERGTRGNYNGVDLNRNYPTKNWIKTEKDEFYSGTHAASEITTRQMTELLDDLKPDIILTLHAPLKCVNYDGPAKELAEKISEFCDYPVIADLGYLHPDRLVHTAVLSEIFQLLHWNTTMKKLTKVFILKQKRFLTGWLFVS